MKGNVHKRELIRLVAAESGSGLAETGRVLDALVTVLARNLARDAAVVWTGLGRFEPRHRRARRGINPQTLEPLTILPTALPGFTVAACFRERVDRERAKGS